MGRNLAHIPPAVRAETRNVQHENDSNPCKVIDDSATLATLRHLFFSEDKPKTLQSIDIAVAAYLVLRKCEDHEVLDSYQTIAERINSERKAVARSLARLQSQEWITVRKRTGQTAALSINTQSMPAEHAVRDKITPEAKTLAANYAKLLLLGHPSIHVDKRMAKRKHFIKNQYASAQRIIGKCGGDRALAGNVTGFAVVHSKHRKAAQVSLYHLLTKWGAIYEYQETRKKGDEK
jgi:hypothetical protein